MSMFLPDWKAIDYGTYAAEEHEDWSVQDWKTHYASLLAHFEYQEAALNKCKEQLDDISSACGCKQFGRGQKCKITFYMQCGYCKGYYTVMPG